MPRANGERKGGLTLETLVSFDDIITDALVDKVYYWATIRKNRNGRSSGSRRMHEEDVPNIIRECIIWNRDPTTALTKLLALPGLRNFMKSLKEEKDKEQFKRHLKRYLMIYMNDCPFEVTTTNRYTITDHEASITARRDIKQREEIKYLTGVQVAMTEEQEKTLELARKDFSLVISSRKKTRSLFLGPARFANHDCEANARLTTTGVDGMQIVAVKPISEGEEITVSYGDDYFGEDNEECLCKTCEDLLQNGWARMKRIQDSDDEDEEDETSNANLQENEAVNESSASRKRKQTADDDDISSGSQTPEKRARIQRESSKQQNSSLLRTATLKKAQSSLSINQEVAISSIEVTTVSTLQDELHQQQSDNTSAPSPADSHSSRNSTPHSLLAADSPDSLQGTDATSVDDDHAAEASQTSKLDPEIIHEMPALGVALVKDEVMTTTVTAPPPTSPPPVVEDDGMSDLSELPSDMEFDSENEQIIRRKPRPSLRTTRSKFRAELQHNRINTPTSTNNPASPEGDPAEYEENPRKPGDYMTSAALLSAKFSKWATCQTCDDSFVQQDGYNTRKECPRCERHSKLYGFAWPKTDREGKHDREERVKDHRTVHRFVDPEEERELRRQGGRRGAARRVSERFGTPAGRESVLSADLGSGRRNRARRSM